MKISSGHGGSEFGGARRVAVAENRWTSLSGTVDVIKWYPQERKRHFFDLLRWPRTLGEDGGDDGNKAQCFVP